MKLIITKPIFFLLFTLASVSAYSQQWLGRTTSNYSGTYGVYNNASSIADSKYLLYFNFWGRGVNFYNNYLDYNAPIKLNKWANDNYILDNNDPNNKSIYQNNWLLENLNGKDKQFSFNQDIWGPAMMFPLSKKTNFSINTRQRSGLQMFGISENFARMAKNGIDSNSGIYNGSNALRRDVSYENGKFAVNAQSYQELSFTLGGVMHQSKKHQFNGGLTLKLIRGLGTAFIKGDNLNMSIDGNQSADINGTVQYGYTDNQSVIDPFNDPYGLFSLNSKGFGAGIDVGFDYTYRSSRLKYRSNQCNYNNRKSDYDLKIAMAFNDIGGIRFNRGSYVYKYQNPVNTNVNVATGILDGFRSNNQNTFDSIGNAVFGSMGVNKNSGFTTALPAAFNFQADFRFTKHFYTQIFLNQNLKPMNSSGLRATSMLSVIPRIESRGFEFSMPLTLSDNYKNFYVGAYARIGPVFFGSDNLGGLLNVASNSNFRGADIYGGISFGIGHCHTEWIDNQVDPVYIDSVRDTTHTEKSINKTDTVVKIKTDTVKIVVKDTIKITKKDTVYINNTNNAELDRIYRNRENEVLRRQREIERRERELLERERNLNQTNAQVLQNCRNQNNTLTEEVNRLRNNAVSKDREIDQLRRDLETARQTNRKYESDLLVCKTCPDDLVKKNAEIVKLQAEIDALRKNTTQTNAEVIKKAELDKAKAEADAIVLRKRVDSLGLVILNKQKELDLCKIDKSTGDIKKCEEEKALLNLEMIEMAKNINRLNTRVYSLTYRVDSLYNELNKSNKALEDCKRAAVANAEVIKKAEADKAKAETDAEIAKKKAEELNLLLIARTAELEKCKSSNTNETNAEVIKKAEADKAKAEADAEIAKKRAEELNQLLVARTAELEKCKSSNTNETNAEVIKKAEADKAKAEADAEIAKKRAEELNLLLIAKTAELEKCKQSSTSTDADILKIKKCEDENEMLKAEMKALAANVGRLNTRNSILTYRVDSLINVLKNSSSSNNSSTEAELLKKCREAEVQYKAEITGLKNTITAKNKTIDSTRAAAEVIVKKQAELSTQVNQLKAEIETLKASSSSNDCADLKKQLEEKNAQILQLNKDKSDLQFKINSLTNQLNETRVEYNFVVKQSQRCNQKLDSCMRGLYNKDIVPDEKDKPTEGSGPYQGNRIENTTPPKREEDRPRKTLLGAILEAALESSSTTGSSDGNSGTGTNTPSSPRPSSPRPSSPNTTSSNESTSRPKYDTPAPSRPTNTSPSSTPSRTNTSNNSGVKINQPSTPVPSAPSPSKPRTPDPTTNRQPGATTGAGTPSPNSPTINSRGTTGGASGLEPARTK